MMSTNVRFANLLIGNSDLNRSPMNETQNKFLLMPRVHKQTIAKLGKKSDRSLKRHLPTKHWKIGTAAFDNE